MKNVMAWLRRNCDAVETVHKHYFYGTYMGVKVRLSPCGTMQIGNKDFDRWANSVAYQFFIDDEESMTKQMGMAIIVAAKDERGYMERSVEVMQKLKKDYGL
jgi:hypothetical protein